MTQQRDDDVLRPLGAPIADDFLRGLPRDVVAFLDAVRHAVIATHDGDGAIWQAVVWYAVDEDGILMNSLLGRRWSAPPQDRLMMAPPHRTDCIPRYVLLIICQ